mmetsp:Transcript_110492/g.356647  ORF Transcript_110492/g.356647 Transcript_110492/m.356647 type:complete len:272 (-) Transcript_110492:1794-2609(-)
MLERQQASAGPMNDVSAHLRGNAAEAVPSWAGEFSGTGVGVAPVTPDITTVPPTAVPACVAQALTSDAEAVLPLTAVTTDTRATGACFTVAVVFTPRTASFSTTDVALAALVFTLSATEESFEVISAVTSEPASLLLKSASLRAGVTVTSTWLSSTPIDPAIAVFACAAVMEAPKVYTTSTLKSMDTISTLSRSMFADAASDSFNFVALNSVRLSITMSAVNLTTSVVLPVVLPVVLAVVVLGAFVVLVVALPAPFWSLRASAHSSWCDTS